MEYTDEQWSKILNRIVEVNAAVLMMDDVSVNYRHPKIEQQAFDAVLHKYDPEYKPHITASHVGRRVAIALIAALLAAAMTIMTVSAAREWFINLIRDVFPGDHAIVEVIPDEDIPEFMAYTLGYVPDGYEQTSRRVRETSRLVDLKYARTDNPEQKISFKQMGKGVAKYDHSGDEIGTVNVNGDEATYSRKGDRQTLSWTDGTYNFLMHITDPDVDKKEAILIAESLVPDLATDK